MTVVAADGQYVHPVTVDENKKKNTQKKKKKKKNKTKKKKTKKKQNMGRTGYVSGTLAGGRHAPDLTHVASRATLAAGAIPNGVAARTAWILDPQALKPGVNMPATRLAPEDAAAITAFLGSLQ
jgi:cytochrome c1